MSSVCEPFLRLHPDDNVAVARQAVSAGIEFSCPPHAAATTCETIKMGHKVAIDSIPAKSPIRKYGQIIGFAARDIQPGDWVHTHNVELGDLTLDYAFASDVPPDPEPKTGRTFLGYRRKDGRAGTRNYVAILSTVNCSATTARLVAQRIERDFLPDFPNIDGVISLGHKAGCAMDYGGEVHQVLARTLAGFAKHPNVGACLILGLGCETACGSYLVDNFNLVQLDVPGRKDAPPLVLNIQDCGGIKKTVDRAVAAVRELLPEVNQAERVPVPVSELIVGTECGGSDAYSGITANPAVGVASDLIVAHGGTVILSETPEICGGEHLLTRRAESLAVGEALVERIRWWQNHAEKFGATIDNNPSLGNKEGGLTTIYEKSLGAVAKAGSTALRGVYQYAETVIKKGLVVMDTPGFDPISVTGMVAGGANVIVFTTGRGTCFGCKPVPAIKVASNTPMFQHMNDDIDMNAGQVLEDTPLEMIGENVFEEMIRVASGKKTKGEEHGVGEEEFCPWQVGPIF